MSRKSRPAATRNRRISRTLRLSRKVDDEIKRAAFNDGTSINELIRRAVSDYLKCRKARREIDEFPG